MDDQTIKLILQLTGTKDVEELRSKVKALGGDLDVLDTAQGKAGKSSANMGQTMLQSGRFLQDFFQGGIGGVLNNIEGLTVALGLGSGLAGVLTIVGVAATIAGPKILDFVKQLTDGSNEIPRTGNALKDLDEAIKGVNKRLEDYREKQHLTNTELADYNKLSAEQVKLEKAKADEQQRQADIKKLNELKPAGQEDDDRERAKILQGLLGGQQGELQKAVAATLPRAALDKLNDRLQQAVGEQAANAKNDPFDLAGTSGILQRNIDQARAAVQAEEARRQAQAQDLVARALIHGEKGATGQIRGLADRDQSGQFNDFQRFALGEADPAARRKERQDIEQQRRAAALDRDLKKKKDAADKEFANFVQDQWEGIGKQAQKTIGNKVVLDQQPEAIAGPARPALTAAQLRKQAMKDARDRTDLRRQLARAQQAQHRDAAGTAVRMPDSARRPQQQQQQVEVQAVNLLSQLNAEAGRNAAVQRQLQQQLANEQRRFNARVRTAQAR